MKGFFQAVDALGDVPIDANVLTMVRQSPGAQKLLIGAVKSGKPQEFLRVARAAKSARNLRVVGNVAGLAGDLFCIYMAYCDWQENKRRIAATDNPELKALYERANQLYAVEAGAGATGIVIGGVAMISTYVASGSVLTAIAAPASTVMLPVALAAGTARVYYQALEQCTETWLSEASDWQRRDVAQILAEIKRIAPGRHSWATKATYGSTGTQVEWLAKKAWTATPWYTNEDMRREEERSFQGVESANSSARKELYLAYFRKTTVIPKQAQENDAAYKERVSRFHRNQLAYVHRLTGGSYDLLMNDNLENAAVFAQLAERAYELRETGKSEMVTVTFDDGTTRQFDIADFGKDQSAQRTIEMTTWYAKAITNKFEFSQLCLQANWLTQGKRENEHRAAVAVRDLVMSLLRHRINKFEAHVRTADYRNSWRDWSDDYEQRVVRSLVKMRLRDQVNEVVKFLLDASFADPEKMLSDEFRKTYDQMMRKIHALLEHDPVQLFAQAQQEGISSHHKKMSEEKLIFMVPGTAEEQARYGRRAT